MSDFVVSPIYGVSCYVTFQVLLVWIFQSFFFPVVGQQALSL